MSYTIYADGEVLYTAAMADSGYGVISPRITSELNKAGSLEFTMPPAHPFYNALKKLKTVIIVRDGDDQLFRGRVLSEETDFYKRKTVYCEGELAFLNDSVVRPYDYEGTASSLFRQVINGHCAMVEGYQRLRPGVCDVEGDVNVNETNHMSTLETLNGMIDSYGGYLFTRTENGIRYLDWKKQGDSCGQTIEFGRNLLDITKHITAEDIFTALIPLGKSSKHDRLTIESVNDGEDYIESTPAVSLFGRIWKTQTWDDETDPAALLAKAREAMSRGISEAVTITVKAIDLHLVDVDTQSIRTGSRIRVVSEPHGLDDEFTCSRIVLDLTEPDKSEYTFGHPTQTASGTMATVKQLSSAVGGGSSSQKALEEEVVQMGTDIYKDRERIRLLAWSTMKQGTMTENKQSTINLTADEILNEVSRIDTDDIEGIINSMKSALSQTAAGFTSRVEKNGVISAINQTAESVTIQASKINLSGYVTATQLDAVQSRIDNLVSGTAGFTNLYTGLCSCTSFKIGNITFSGTELVTIGTQKYRILGYKVNA